MKRSRATSKAKSAFNYTLLALIGGVFILGIGIGIAFSSTTTVNAQNVASREVLDRSVANPEFCVKYGASAMVVESYSYITLNPFNVYVSQPRMHPGCVVRNTNWSILERMNVVSSDEVRNCRNRLNTFGFMGDINDNPTVQCIYQNQAQDNNFLRQPGSGVTNKAPESNRF
ncbi:DUF3172 domain-containing protein [Phormidium yuhuli AB48]|uniref:DUF3172 domain-containing protein n=1 Tax=Phormidium yuhuli AB48 TaxID=2940671 RepID=A0ABY5ASI9_9CYAN|nr:DUF3172 domain-containing protein [Phormidium yuhuli]USR92190.1 DUF3172 domain-containing protein [Phormidium yuhuli AB48]